MTRSRPWLAAAVVVLIALAAGGALWRAALHTDTPSAASASAFQIPRPLQEGNFARVRSPWDFRFPADHGPHHKYRTEWWYLTGSVDDERGRRLGLQLVLMRVGLTAEPRERPSDWAASEVYAGLFSVSDPVGGRLHAGQRASRAALGLAGSAVQPFQVWVENWRLMAHLGTQTSVLIARAETDGAAVDLQLRSQKPLVDGNEVRGERSALSAPFHFYLRPRLHAQGSLRVGERQTAIEGTLAMEHAWGELPLPGGPVALDRFTLHLDDGRELFCVRRHRTDGSGTPATTGLLIGHNDRPRVLPRTAIELEPIAYWESPQTGARYPIRWALRVRDHGITMELIPYWENQEAISWGPYWAGPVRLRGTSPTMALAGDGFVQLNGYHGS